MEREWNPERWVPSTVINTDEMGEEVEEWRENPCYLLARRTASPTTKKWKSTGESIANIDEVQCNGCGVVPPAAGRTEVLLRCYLSLSQL